MKRLIFIIFCITLFSCQQEPEKKNIVVDKQKLRENIINVNKPAVVMEQDEINAYIKAHGYTMQSTGTGLRYMFIHKNEKGKKIEPKSEITVNYKVWLLDGTLCYSSEKKGPKKFIVDADNIETGVHEGVKLMREGEKALFILPSHLAFGLIGDRDKIPPKAAVVYEIEVIRVK
jgi:FKBP-type peptidyl-prolyl cis-trans isomerase